MDDKRLMEIWKMMINHQRETGFNMTTRKIAERCGLKSNSNITIYLEELERRGMLKYSGHQIQAIRPNRQEEK
jgi:SOS-response transcriptional repressor LexA